jgi:hypothetical protein
VDSSIRAADAPDVPIQQPPRPSVDETEKLEQSLSRGNLVDLPVLGGHRDAIFSTIFRDRPTFSLAWPPGWYIPGDADFRSYWVTPPPPGNRYQFGWANSQLYPGNTVLKGSKETGQVYSYTALLPSDSSDSVFCGVAARFQPSSTLSFIDVSIDVDIVAHSRIWTLLARPTSSGPTVHIRCTAFVCVWHIDPVTNAWELVRPFGSQTLANRSESGQGGSPIMTQNTHFAGNGLATRVQVESGRSYAVGFQAQVDIDAHVLDTSHQPYQRGDGDDWKLWADMSCFVRQITIATQVLVP